MPRKTGAKKPQLNKKPKTKHNEAVQAEVVREQKAVKKAAKKEAASNGMLSGLGEGLGGMAGGFLGGPAGAGIGKFLGGKLGHLASTITGFGDYEVDDNSLLKGGMPVPQVVNSMDKGTTIVRHCEYIGDVKSSIGFTIDTFDLNPGLPNTFPWLAQTANSYEQYRFRGMIIEFRTTSSNAVLSSSASTALGSVMMATQYDVADPLFVDKRTMLNHEYSNSTDPSKSAIHLIECKKSLNVMSNQFTRSGPPPAGTDPRMYDLGRFTIATVGCQNDGGTIGELWISYEVELLKSQYNLLGFQDQFPLLHSSSTFPLGVTGGGHTGWNGTISNTLGGQIGVTGGKSAYFFPPNVSSGIYNTYSVWGNSSGATGPIAFPAIGGHNIKLFDLDYINLPSASSTTQFATTWRNIQVVGPEAFISYDGSGLIPTNDGRAPSGMLSIAYIGNDPNVILNSLTEATNPPFN